MIGKVVGSYVILKKLGAGAFGTVYLAEHRVLGRLAALKCLKQARNKQALLDFIKEARILAAVEAPQVVKVYDVFEAGGKVFIAMEYFPAKSLVDIDFGVLSKAKKLSILTQLLQGLSEVHARGVIHRDLKLENLLYDPARNELRIVDFGIAKVAEDGKTRGGYWEGTMPYMSPEQWCAEPLDARSDLFSVGVILYLLLVGEFPFWGEDPDEALAERKGKEHLKALRSVERDAWLAGLVGRLLAFSKRQRPASAGEILADSKYPVKVARQHQNKPQNLKPDDLLTRIIAQLPAPGKSIAQEALIRQTARALGIGKVGKKIRHQFILAINRGVKAGLMAKTDGIIEVL